MIHWYMTPVQRGSSCPIDTFLGSLLTLQDLRQKSVLQCKNFNMFFNFLLLLFTKTEISMEIFYLFVNCNTLLKTIPHQI